MATQALFDAIRANDHDAIRTIKESHPGSKWNDVHEIRCTCWCIREFGDESCTGGCRCSGSRLQVALVDALVFPNVTIETCRLLFDLGITGPTSCAFLLHLANGVDNYTHKAAHDFLFTCCYFDGRARRDELLPPAGSENMARNFLTMCEWYDPRALAELRWPCSFKRSKLENETIIGVALRSDIVTRYQCLRAPFIKWLNDLLSAGCPLPRNSDGFCYDKWLLAVRSLYVDETTNTVRDDMPQLQTDERLFRRWMRRHIFYGQRAEIHYYGKEDYSDEELDQCGAASENIDSRHDGEEDLCVEFQNAEDCFDVNDSEFDSGDDGDELLRSFNDNLDGHEETGDDSLWWKTWTPWTPRDPCL